jgi:ABC-type oligopeptide transport system ATPase subunit
MTATAPRPLALRVTALCKACRDIVAVNPLDLTVNSGECFGLLGPNGAGKTTTIEICEGLTVPNSGSVEVLGRRWDHDERALRERLNIQLQETQLAEKLTVLKTVTLFRSFYARGRSVRDVIDVVQLGENLSARVDKLSGEQSSVSHWHAQLSAIRSCSSSTNRRRGWTGNHVDSSGTSSRNPSATAAALYSRRITWTKRSSCVTASPSSIMARSLRLVVRAG